MSESSFMYLYPSYPHLPPLNQNPSQPPPQLVGSQVLPQMAGWKARHHTGVNILLGRKLCSPATLVMCWQGGGRESVGRMDAGQGMCLFAVRVFFTVHGLDYLIFFRGKYCLWRNSQPVTCAVELWTSISHGWKHTVL